MVGVPPSLIYTTMESYPVTSDDFYLLAFSFFVADYVPTYPESSSSIRPSYRRGFSLSGDHNCTARYVHAPVALNLGVSFRRLRSGLPILFMSSWAIP